MLAAKRLIQSENNDDRWLRLPTLHAALDCHDTFLFNSDQESLIAKAHERIAAVQIQYLNENIHSVSSCMKLKGVPVGLCNTGCTLRCVLNAVVFRHAFDLTHEPPEERADLAFGLSS